MSRIQYSIVYAALALTACQVRPALAREHWIEGKVTDFTGGPLPGVLLLSDRVRPPVTGTNGRYLMDMGDALAITFYLKGYKPYTKIVGPTSKIVDAKLERDNGQVWKIPACLDTTFANNSLAEYFFFPGADHDKSKRSSDTDVETQRYVYKVGSLRFVLEMWEGSFCCTGVPPSKFYVGSRAYHQRRFEAPRFNGIDSSGIDQQGTYWRYVGPASGLSVGYRNASKQAATYFNQVIDSMCFQSGSIRKEKP